MHDFVSDTIDKLARTANIRPLTSEVYSKNGEPNGDTIKSVSRDRCRFRGLIAGSILITSARRVYRDQLHILMRSLLIWE